MHFIYMKAYITYVFNKFLQDEIAYSIVGAQPENIFYIQQTGGLIFVTKSLRSTSVDTYTVSFCKLTTINNMQIDNIKK